MKFIFLLMALSFTACANSQQTDTRLVGGACEGCEAVFEYGDRELSAVDTLPEFESAADKLKLTGTIYEPDGETPAEGVILYIHHTNAEGIYPTRGGEQGWEKRHGYLRGWTKTGKDGKYTFYTQIPKSYPSRTEPAHIHPYILEPDGKYYWLESYFFEGDPLLKNYKFPAEGEWRGGGKGVLKLQQKENMAVVQRDFILGKNIPEY
ncbi:intradiol ring-cleavage dioxygenase [Salinimicrobium xinjiangense]|uniref:intradiol ring-cleavage dioxygenase n=1 Tax=Salinimicrobium xinjiangense TaxID=438596 RepID=UPI000406102C|nr:intradiol ring-cleavage dioxygenase [Salinimicrobium xinjiangense]